MNNQKLLRNTLKANGIFSFLSGLDLLLFNKQFMEWFGIANAYIFPIIGAGLIVFSLTVFLEAFRKEMQAGKIKIIIGQDILWVVASVFILATNIFSLSPVGLWLTGGVALIVALFAFLQYRGLA